MEEYVKIEVEAIDGNLLSSDYTSTKVQGLKDYWMQTKSLIKLNEDGRLAM